ncbi:MAG TPA: N-acetyltransferase [Solirubrobacteraceae bacterium]|nr:N-acetyltransferase [Solirubrobacteraceae bacterium]
MTVREATPEDAEAIGRLLDDFNREFDDPTPGPAALAERVAELLADGELTVLLADPGPVGVSVLRFWPSLWTPALECHVTELYVVPEHRGRGTGRALMDASLALARQRGADYVDLFTSEDDVAARALYESLGFTNDDDGSAMLFYEREL